MTPPDACPPNDAARCTPAQDPSRSVAAAAAHWRALQTASPAALITCTPQAEVISWNAAAERMFGYRASEMSGREITALCLPGLEPEWLQRMAALEPGAEPQHLEARWRHADGREVPVALSCSAVADEAGEPIGICVLARDLGAQRDAEALIWRHTHIDELTGLPNRRHFIERVGAALGRAKTSSLALALLVIDLDHFKLVNDHLGHRAGDELLTQAAARIRDCLRSADEVGRQGGDEFNVLLPVLTQPDDVDTVCSRLGDALREPFTLGDETVSLSASIGIALFPQHGRNADELLAHADQAMYDAKQRGRDQARRYTDTMRLAHTRRQRLLGDLRQALDRHEMLVVYQPVMDRDGAPCGFEAVMRWNHPVLGAVGPTDFLPLAEDCGLVRPLAQWMFTQATHQLSEWRQRFGLDLSLTFGLSAATLLELRLLLEAWKSQTLRPAVPPATLLVEISEDLFDAQRQVTEAALQALRAEGCRLAVRQFGGGRVCVADLQRLGVHQVKLAPALVDALGPGSPALALADGLTALAHRLGMKAGAGGVTSARQLEWLADIGCDQWQGAWISPPLDGAAATAWLQRWVASQRVAANQAHVA